MREIWSHPPGAAGAVEEALDAMRLTQILRELEFELSVSDPNGTKWTIPLTAALPDITDGASIPALALIS